MFHLATGFPPPLLSFYFILAFKYYMWYFIRLTTESTTKQELGNLLGEPYLISKEYSKRNKLHYHILWESSLDKEELKNFFYESFPDEPKGTGTLQIDKVGDTLTDWEQVGTYTVKDGDYIHTPQFDGYIENWVANSYQKVVPYNTALKGLIERSTNCETHRINWQKLKIDIAILRSDYHLEVYRSKVEALVLSIRIGFDHNVAFELFSSD